jgi:hypothetical protein
MSDAPDPLTGLDELAACDLRLAKRFCARIESLPEDDDDKAMDLARSYQRMARSYRQTLVVQARLRRDLKADARQEAADETRRHERRVSDRKVAIKARMADRVWNEREDEDEAEGLYSLFLDLVDAAAERRDFLEHDVDVHVRAIADALGLDDAEASPSEAPAADRAGPPPAADAQAPILFNGRLAPPMDIPPWADDSS